MTTCPHCWTGFDPVDALAVASHEDLRGDVRLGRDEFMRFLPSRFLPDGTPIDARGLPSPHRACPRCHLPVPTTLFDAPPLFVSILGAPGCGKSFYLTALTWECRRLLPLKFALSFADADPAANVALADSEKTLFLSAEPDRPVPLGNLIRKTQLDGSLLYSTVTHAGQTVRYPRPFMFHVRPADPHPAVDKGLARTLCVYDNAGEQFQPGADSAAAPVTHHLARSAAWLFLFDPTMDPRFRDLCGQQAGPPRSERQESILLEAALRAKRAGAAFERPLVVVLTKADVWGEAAGVPADEPFREKFGHLGLDAALVSDRSDRLRKLLTDTCPELVLAADATSSSVTFFAASVVGVTPALVPVGGRYEAAVKPGDVRPRGVVAPLLFALSRAVPKLVPAVRRKDRSDSGGGE